MSIKAIETTYKGYRFRSRLEARWAVFFDHLGLRWEYEPEGFELGGGVRYLPDFYIGKYIPGLVGYGPWLEVKAVAPTPSEINKLAAICEAHCCYGMFVWGMPGDDTWLAIHKEGFVYDGPLLSFDGSSGSSLTDHLSANYFQEKWFAFCYDQAVNAARSARFEFGQSGARA